MAITYLDYTATTILEKFQNETTTQNLEKALKTIAVAKTEEALAVSFLPYHHTTNHADAANS